jgi:hypothetical protein
MTIDVDITRTALITAVTAASRCLTEIETAMAAGAEDAVDAVLDAEIATGIDVEDLLTRLQHQIGELTGYKPVWD